MRQHGTELHGLGEGAHFLPRRMSENYLLSARAIASVANSIEGFRQAVVREEEVQQLLDRKRADLRYYCPGTAAVPVDWINHIDGARVLTEIFSELSKNREDYEKTKHSVAITIWILDDDPEHLRELAEWLSA
jgi:hypothetical protein